MADVLGSRDVMLSHLKVNLEKAQQLMIKQANKHRRPGEYQVGHKEFLKVRPYRQTSVSRQPHHKLSAKFYGPFLVKKRVGPTAYRLSLPTSSRIHHVFHVSQPRRVVGEHPVELELPESLELPVGPVFEPEAVLAWWNVQEGGQDEEHILMKWVGQHGDDAS